MKPIIGIVGRPITSETGREVEGIYHTVHSAVTKKGGISLGIIPPRQGLLTKEEKEDLYKVIDLCDGLIAQGGEDFYDYDFIILEYAYQKDIPVLGICLGMQAMSVLMNGEMKDHKETINHNQKGIPYVHEVNISKESKLYEILGKETILVNSRHNSYVTKTDLKISGYSNTMIESVEDSDKAFFIGVQWHPEDMFTYDILASTLLDYFINICKG